MPTAKLCFKLAEIERASQVRRRRAVMTVNARPLTNTAPSRCCQPIPIAAKPKAMKAFSPM